MKKCAELMAYSKGGVTLDYIENVLTPFERDQYWETYLHIERQKIEAEIQRTKGGIPMAQAIGM